MERRGFTLTELIVTIALMVLMGVVIANNLGSLFSKQEDSDVTDFKENLENAACTYIDLSDPQIKQKKNTCKTSGCSVTTSVLILNGLLEDDLVNPLTGRAITGSEVVTISYPNQEKTCTYNVEG